MKHLELEKELTRRMKKRRVIGLAVCAVLLTIAIVFTVLYEQSKVVHEVGFGPIKHQSVTYNTDLLWGLMISWVPLIPLVIVVICDYLFVKFHTVQVGDDYITLHRGFSSIALYINGEERDSIILNGYHLEAALSDGSKVHVALGKWSAYLTFTNGHPPIDL